MEATVIDIVRSVVDDSEAEIRPETDLIDGLGLDSVSMLDLITTLEERLGVTFPDEDLDLNNFRSILNITATAKRCLTQD